MFLNEDDVLELELDCVVKFKVLGIDDINFHENSDDFYKWIEHNASSVLKFEPLEIEEGYEYPEIDEEIIEYIAEVKLERIKEACYDF